MIRRAVAQKLLDEVSSTAVLEVFAQAGAGWAILELSREVAERAEGSFPVEPVRTLDALHLASALLLRQALPDLRILSTDDRVRSNGRGLGFEVFPARGGAVAPALRRPARANRRPGLGRRRGVVREQQRPCWAARSGV